jgi:hypothetical protein
LYPFPGGLIPSSRYTQNAQSFIGLNGIPDQAGSIGKGHMATTSGTGAGALYLQWYSSGPAVFRAWFIESDLSNNAYTGGVGSNAFALSNTNISFSMDVDYEVSTLSSTPIKDR